MTQNNDISIAPQTARIAAVQAKSVWLDLDGGVDKVCIIIKETGEKGVEVLEFPVRPFAWLSRMLTYPNQTHSIGGVHSRIPIPNTHTCPRRRFRSPVPKELFGCRFSSVQ